MDRWEAYRLLEVPAGASEEQARRAYKLLINVWHPDRFEANKEVRARAEAQTQRLNEAIALLSAAGFPPPEAVPTDKEGRTPPVEIAVTCPACGVGNRIRVESVSRILKCGRCSQPFSLTAQIERPADGGNRTQATPEAAPSKRKPQPEDFGITQEVVRRCEPGVLSRLGTATLEAFKVPWFLAWLVLPIIATAYLVLVCGELFDLFRMPARSESEPYERYAAAVREWARRS